jgi:hypothetical protein
VKYPNDPIRNQTSDLLDGSAVSQPAGPPSARDGDMGSPNYRNEGWHKKTFFWKIINFQLHSNLQLYNHLKLIFLYQTSLVV